MSEDDWPAPAQSTTPMVIGEDLSALSVNDLKARLTALDEEKKRVQAEIEARGSQAELAQKLFKSDT